MEVPPPPPPPRMGTLNEMYVSLINKNKKQFLTKEHTCKQILGNNQDIHPRLKVLYHLKKAYPISANTGNPTSAIATH